MKIIYQELSSLLKNHSKYTTHLIRAFSSNGNLKKTDICDMVREIEQFIKDKDTKIEELERENGDLKDSIKEFKDDILSITAHH